MADVQLARRNGTGTAGKRVLVLANAFRVTGLPDGNIMHYDVEITPEVPPRVNRQVYYAMKTTNGLFGKIAAVYDGRKNIFSPAKLPFPGDDATAEVFLPDEDRPPRPGQEPRGRVFTVKIRLVAQVNLYELQQFVRGKSEASSNILMAITALNVMVRNDPSLIYPSKGASFYPPPRANEQAYIIKGGLEMWAGYFTSIRPTPDKMIVNIDRTAMPFIQSGDLVQVVTRFMGARDPADLTRVMDRTRNTLERFCKGLVVATRQISMINGGQTAKKRFKIRALSRMPANELTFTNDVGAEVTIAQYFQQQYNYTLRFPGLPCVQVTKKAWYPMEILEVERGNKYTKKLTPDQVSEALKFTTQPPNRRLQLVREGFAYLSLGRSETTRAWNFSVEQTPLQVKARVLDPPTLLLADGRGPGPSEIMPRDGAWDVRGKRSSTGSAIKRWMAIVFDTEQGLPGRRDSGFPLQMAQGSVTALARACRDFGINIENPQPTIFYAGDTMDVRGAFMETARRAGFSPNTPPQLIVTYVPMKNSKQYGLIKQIGDISLGVATQNLVIQKVRSAKPSYYQNVALKVNVKLAGINQIVKNGIIPEMDKRPTIVFGADVSHPGPGSFAPSIAALVASHDLGGLQYATQVRVQPNREEVIRDLDGMAVALIKKYYKSTKRKPERIVFYRDGVSEGQYPAVCRDEIAKLKKACLSIDPSYAPPITYVICAKRHHIRFFPSTQDGGDRSGNVQAGTVVDMDIVSPTDNDFYLMSHGGLLGTSRPCHYTVLQDQNKFTPDQLQRLTYNLAYIYPRATRSVSIVAPAYFAHLVADRGRKHLGGDAEDDSSTMISSASSGRDEAQRDQRLASARERLRQIHANLESTMYFM